MAAEEIARGTIAYGVETFLDSKNPLHHLRLTEAQAHTEFFFVGDLSLKRTLKPNPDPKDTGKAQALVKHKKEEHDKKVKANSSTQK